MLGKDLYRIESNISLSSDEYKSLVIFYEPLIGPNSLALYEYLMFIKTYSFDELSNLINALNFSIEKLEESLNKLNEYRLLQTLKDKNTNRFIFVLNKPLDTSSFIKDDIFVRDFIQKTSGVYYQKIVSDIKVFNNHDNYEDISKKLSADILNGWTKEDESYLKMPIDKLEYNFNTFFNVNEFLKDISFTLLPLKFRSEDNMKEIATLADLYNISIDQMRKFIPKVIKSDSNSIDFKFLRYLCENSESEFRKIENGVYNVPCELFLINKQDGKELTNYDKNLIYNLSHNNHLTPPIINVLLESCLKKYDNRLVEKYLYPVASDLHRKNIETVDEALKFLNDEVKTKKKASINPTYDASSNPTLNDDEFNKYISRRNKQ